MYIRNFTQKILLLQIRADAVVREEELISFAKYLEIDQSYITILNVFDTPDFTPNVIDQYDALIVGGASEASVLDTDRYPFVKNCQNLLLYCEEKSIPVFASCFGFQLAVLAFGGNITRELTNFEMGTIEIEQTKLGHVDPIFRGIPKNFFAVSVHQESAFVLPTNCNLLAKTDYCCHSFKVKNKPFWAFQFHPELDQKTLIDRLGVYRTKYTDDQNHYHNIIDSLVDTDEAHKLLLNFKNYICKD